MTCRNPGSDPLSRDLRLELSDNKNFLKTELFVFFRLRNTLTFLYGNTLIKAVGVGSHSKLLV